MRDWDEYLTFGGMPQTVLERNEREKVAVLNELFGNVYIKDVVERNGIADATLLESIIDVVSSAVGSLTNPKRLSDTIISREGGGPSAPTVRKYLGFLKEAYIFRKIVVTSGASRLWTDDNGISYVGVLTFLLEPESMLP